MNKLIFLFLLIFLIPFANAENILVKTNITLNAVSWYENNTNISKMNITIFTENIDGTQNFIVNNANNIYNGYFLITFLRDLNCGNTSYGELNSYFSECEGGLCKDKYTECKYGKTNVELNKQTCDSHLAECTSVKNSLESNVSYYLSNYNDAQTNINKLNDEIIKLKKDNKNKIEWWYLLILILLAYLFRNNIIDYLNKTKRTGKKGQEEKLGTEYLKDDKIKELYDKY